LVTKKISLKKFEEMIEMGKRMNPLYIKIRNKYGERTKQWKPKYKKELEKLLIKTGKNFAY